MKNLTLFLALAFFSMIKTPSALQAQSTIRGVLQTSNGTLLSSANVLLLTATDSAFVKGEISREDGSFEFHNVSVGTYWINISMLGYQDQVFTSIKVDRENSTIDLATTTLQTSTAELASYTVAAKKSMYEQKIDRLVINVAGSITAAGATVLDVLARSPGVQVNRQSNTLAIMGKNGVVVMINGKINRMPAEAVVQMLAAMPSSNIEKIELITTPPANFDAEGNAGYINIIFKQTGDQGLNGSYNLTGGLGKGTTAGGGFNFNYRKGSLNLFGDYSVARQAQETSSFTERTVELNGDLIHTSTSGFRRPSLQRNHNLRLGLDWNWGKKTVLGALLTGFDNRYSQSSVNHSILMKNGKTDTLIEMANNEINLWQNLGANLNVLHHFKEGESLSIDLDYLNYYNNQPANYLASYLNRDQAPLFDKQIFSGKKTPINVEVLKIDYTKQWNKNVKMQVGIKGTASQFDNEVTVLKGQNGVLNNDPNLSARYRLLESIGAAYTAFDIKVDDKTNLKLGLRYEYTNSNLGTTEKPNIVDRHYGRFFPSFFASRTFNDDHSASLAFTRRITRPTFNDLAPFIFFIDPYTFLSGNAALQPAISNSIKADYRYKSILFSMQYTHEDSAIVGFQPRLIPGTNKQLYVAQNMKNQKTAAFSLGFPWQVTKWWNMQNNFTFIWQASNTYYYQNPYHLQTKNLQINWINSFKLPRNFNAELSGFYQSKSLNGGYVALPLGMLNAGIQKKLKGNGGALRFGVDNIFNSLKLRFVSHLPEYNIDARINLVFTQRTFKISYTKDFGNNQLKRTRERELGSASERSRVNN